MRYGPFLHDAATKPRVSVWYRTLVPAWALSTAQREQRRDLIDPLRSRGVYWIARAGAPAHRLDTGALDARA